MDIACLSPITQNYMDYFAAESLANHLSMFNILNGFSQLLGHHCSSFISLLLENPNCWFTFFKPILCD